MRTPPRMLSISLLVILAGGAASALAQAPLRMGEVRPQRTETPHPYPVGAESRPVVWSDRVVSPGATFLRIHFTGLSLAPGDYVTVADPEEKQVWTYSGRGPHADGDVWSFAVDGDTALVRIHGGRGAGHGYLIDAVGHGTRSMDPVPELICGTDGREDVACHSPEIDAAQRPVARLLWIKGNLILACTGWLVAGSNPDTLITNQHCISKKPEVRSLQATFNLQRTACGGGTSAATTNYAGGALLSSNNLNLRGQREGLDYTLLTLQGNPEATWGELTPTTKSVAAGDLIWFIQHPGGGPKTVGYWDDSSHTVRCDVATVGQTYGGSAPGSQTGYACDSEGGSSGSPIVDPGTGRVIALHHFGNVVVGGCLNAGTAMSRICADTGSLLSCVAN